MIRSLAVPNAHHTLIEANDRHYILHKCFCHSQVDYLPRQVPGETFTFNQGKIHYFHDIVGGHNATTVHFDFNLMNCEASQQHI